MHEHLPHLGENFFTAEFTADLKRKQNLLRKILNTFFVPFCALDEHQLGAQYAP
jgi:hypothetical protein